MNFINLFNAYILTINELFLTFSFDYISFLICFEEV